jgi:hypothetical protein
MSSEQNLGNQGSCSAGSLNLSLNLEFDLGSKLVSRSSLTSPLLR